MYRMKIHSTDASGDGAERAFVQLGMMVRISLDQGMQLGVELSFLGIPCFR